MIKQRLFSIIAVIIFVFLETQLFAGTVTYPKKWGQNLAAASAGSSVVFVSSDERNAQRLIDGQDGEGNHWEPVWSQGRPWFFILDFSKQVDVGIILFSTHSDLINGGVPKTVEILAATESPNEMKVVHKATLKNEKVQVIEIDNPFLARYLKVMVLSDYGKRGGEIGEVGIFARKSIAHKVFRGTKKHDILELKNGDVLTGITLNESITMQTSYAKLSFSKKQLASLILEDDTENVEKLILVNNDVFSGFILDKSIKFKLNTGPEIEIRREKIKRLGIQMRKSEKRRYPENDLLTLKNGDIFTGRVSTVSISVATSYATVPVTIKDVVSIEFIGKDRVVTKITLRNKNQIQGLLKEEDIAVDLDYGPEVNIYKDKIDKIVFH